MCALNDLIIVYTEAREQANDGAASSNVRISMYTTWVGHHDDHASVEVRCFSRSSKCV